ncbi:MAG: response regulator [Clostridia bacterium]|nr:response regulator [Clostridia bacterium]
MSILEEEGFTVDHVEDGLKCVEKLREASSGYYDLILMDVQMPNMNGYQATEQI